MAAGGFDFLGHFPDIGRSPLNVVHDEVFRLRRILLLQIAEDNMELVVELMAEGAEGIHHLV